jgi:predicted ester cyclase
MALRTRLLMVALALVSQTAALAGQSGPHDGSALAREIFTVVDNGDLGRAAALLADDLQLHYAGVPDTISKTALLEMIRSNYSAFPDARHDLQEVLPSGNFVTVRLVAYGTHKGSYEGIAATGRQVVVSAIHIFRIANGRIVEWWAAEDDLGLLRQIGAVVGPPFSRP